MDQQAYHTPPGFRASGVLLPLSPTPRGLPLTSSRLPTTTTPELAGPYVLSEHSLPYTGIICIHVHLPSEAMSSSR